MTAAGLAMLVPQAAQAAAASPDPVAIGMSHGDADTRVLNVSGDGKTNKSPVVNTVYQPGLTGADVVRQRWTFVAVRQSEEPGAPYRYQVRNVGSKKCLDRAADKVDGAAVYISTCSDTSVTQVWTIDPTDTNGDLGMQLVSAQDGRCLDNAGLVTNNNQKVHVWKCSLTQWNHRWKIRTGTFDCPVYERRYFTETKMCVRGAQNMIGLMANWRNEPMSLAYRDPSTYVLANEAMIHAGLTGLDSQLNTYGHVEFGWHVIQLYNDRPAVYDSYWTENTGAGETYNALPATDPMGNPTGADEPNGMNHTYLALGNPDSNQWDLYYDYNFIASTSKQRGFQSADQDYGLYARYVDATSIANPVQVRTQLMTGANVWHKPELANTAVTNPKRCDGPPVWDDFSAGSGMNKPPYCVVDNRATDRADASLLDRFTITKADTTSSATPADPGGGAGEATGRLHGVDQAALAACAADDPASCLRTVPGLAACMAAHQQCHTLPATRHAAVTDKPVTAKQAILAARTWLGLPAMTGAANSLARIAQTTTAGRVTSLLPGARLPSDVATDRDVYVVTGTDAVHGIGAASTQRYDGWSMVIDRSTGRLLYARLGR
jgi:hypothetical protein